MVLFGTKNSYESLFNPIKGFIFVIKNLLIEKNRIYMNLQIAIDNFNNTYMQAKYYKKIRKQCSWFDVQHTSGMFGEFCGNLGESTSIRVLARNHYHACKRAVRRGYGHEISIKSETTSKWAHWRVKLSSKTDHFRNVKYF